MAFLLRRAWDGTGCDCGCIQGGKLGRATKTRGSCSIRGTHRPRKPYVVLEAPVDEDVNEFGLTWSLLMNRDVGGRASDKSQIVWLPVKKAAEDGCKMS